MDVRRGDAIGPAQRESGLNNIAPAMERNSCAPFYLSLATRLHLWQRRFTADERVVASRLAA